MKKILYGTVVLCFFAIALILTELSCQKTIGQSTKPNDETGSFVLYYKSSEVKVPVVTQTDSGTNTSYLYYYPIQYFTTDLNGGSELQIPINMPGNLYVGDGGKLTSDGATVIFKAFTIPDANNANSQQCYTYACSLDGSNLRKLRDDCGFSDVH